jgi:hypothetical protein
MEALAGLTQMTLLNELIVAADGGVHCLTLDDLAERITHPRKTIVKRMQALMSNGFAKSVRVGCYAATPKGHKRHMEGGEIKSGPKTAISYREPNRASLRARLWKALRTLKRGTVSDLIQVAAKPEEVPTARDSAHRFLSQLTRAGYARKLPRRSNPTRDCSNGEVIYFLINDTGVLPPMETTDKETGARGLKDRNTKAFTPYAAPQKRPPAVGRVA